MMDVTVSRSALRSALGSWRRGGESIALVPTMGNLHAGHMSLVERAQQEADRVVVSIFVNPLQFGPNEDLDGYPRTLERDCLMLQQAGVDLVFTPSEAELYPYGRTGISVVTVPGLSELLCGASRPGHFTGVTTVVAKLFNLIQPDCALFGEKDYQQLAIIRRMVIDLDFPVTVIGMPTRREADGLAMSSRNGYLSEEQRTLAPQLYALLQWLKGRVQQGERNFADLERQGCERLAQAGFVPDYLMVRALDLEAPDPSADTWVVLVAARLGGTRLIDNLVVAAS